jgi:hypothetical protein
MASVNLPGVTTITDRLLSGFAIVLTLGAGLAAASVVLSHHWFRHAPVLAVAYLAFITVAVIWGCFRAWRIGLSMDEQGITVRNYFWTHRFGWTEVRCFENGWISKAEGEGKDVGGVYRLA